MDVRNTVLADQCPLEVDFPCQPRKYRAYNGYCNNVQNPRWGNANTRYLRFLPPDYSDGKTSVNNIHNCAHDHFIQLALNTYVWVFWPYVSTYIWGLGKK